MQELLNRHANFQTFFSLNNLKRQHKFKPMHDDQFRQLLDWFGFSWSGYRKVRQGVKKRISRHMQELKCANINTYLDLLNKNAELRQECQKRMTVSISRFFRDRQLWHDLADDVLPRMIESEKKALRVWSAGCARGEEVYSFKIVWDRLKKQYPLLPEIEIVATDIHPDYIDKARAGVYTKSSMEAVTEDVRDHYFDIGKSGNRFDIKTAFKRGIEWRVQDIFSDPPGSAFDMIFLRNNLLTYYTAHLKKEGLKRVISALAPEGWLIVGSHEKLPSGISNVQRHHSIPWAYRQDL
jgi:chemotaxis methyl-accepting protein methylase